MADEINVTVTTGDTLDISVESDTEITVENQEITQENAIADETPLEITIEGDGDISVYNSDAKEGYIRETFTNKTGINQVLIFSNPFRTNSLIVFFNGVLMEKNVDYSEGVDRDRITILDTLESSDKIECRYVIN